MNCICGHPATVHRMAQTSKSCGVVGCNCANYQSDGNKKNITEKEAQGLPVSFRIDIDPGQDLQSGILVIYSLNGRLIMQSRNIDPAESVKILRIITEK